MSESRERLAAWLFERKHGPTWGWMDVQEDGRASWRNEADEILAFLAPASDAGTGPRETQGERERLAEELDYDVVPALFARASEAFYREHDVAAWRRRAEAVEAAARLLRSAPPREPARCHTCGNPATCYGSYENQPSTFACDDCCGHGCENGQCVAIVRAPGGAEQPEREGEHG